MNWESKYIGQLYITSMLTKGVFKVSLSVQVFYCLVDNCFGRKVSNNQVTKFESKRFTASLGIFSHAR